MSAAATMPIEVGRYAIFDRIAAGGMAAVHLARLVGQGGFARTVAVKRLHPQFAIDPEFVAMFLDEARLAARIRHPNVVSTLDIVAGHSELFLVMEYVEGESLATLLRSVTERGERVPVGIAAGIMVQVLHGLHAAHEAKNDHGEPLDLVHRDVSPQNVLVGTDGVARVLDFGVAKAFGKLHTTREGQLKGKLGYLAPEQVLGHPVSRRSDVFAAAVVLWEALAGRRLFAAESEGDVLRRIMDGVVEPPSRHVEGLPDAVDAVVMRALAKEPADRFDTALAMAEAVERSTPIAPARSIGSWMRDLMREQLAIRSRLLADIESRTGKPAPPAAPIDAESTAPLATPKRRAPWPWVAIGAAIVLGGGAEGVRVARAHAGHERTVDSVAAVGPPASLAIATAPTTTTATTTATTTTTATATTRPLHLRSPTVPKPTGKSLYTRE
jgi:serine/threonine-protein kinase